MSQKKDYWWELDEGTFTIIGTEIINVVKQIAEPEILKNIEDDDLEALWLSGNADGLTDLQRLINLTTLLKFYRKDNINLVIDELKTYAQGKPYEFIARLHIKQLGFT